MLFTKLFPDEFYRWGSGIVDDLWSTRWEYMRRIVLPKPPLNERIKIVEILDAECSKIDESILYQEATIKRLEELKQSLINEVTTRGLQKDRSKKPSGHAWIGDIPIEWNMVYSKSLFALRKDKAFTDDDFPVPLSPNNNTLLDALPETNPFVLEINISFWYSSPTRESSVTLLSCTTPLILSEYLKATYFESSPLPNVL